MVGPQRAAVVCWTQVVCCTKLGSNCQGRYQLPCYVDMPCMWLCTHPEKTRDSLAQCLLLHRHCPNGSSSCAVQEPVYWSTGPPELLAVTLT